ncbi:MAG TPA: T9SS type A sorting domain-containing protein [Candidatus Kapabacteria bacterium]|nr:T9SS type A sorting domain-containing protein [Candidatus Kapabacteria bacterium]
MEANRMTAYPNQIEDVIEVENFTINGSFAIYDIYGHKIDNVQFNLKNNGITLMIQNLTSGVYYLRTENDYLLFVKN